MRAMTNPTPRAINMIGAPIRSRTKIASLPRSRTISIFMDGLRGWLWGLKRPRIAPRVSPAWAGHRRSVRQASNRHPHDLLIGLDHPVPDADHGLQRHLGI